MRRGAETTVKCGVVIGGGTGVGVAAAEEPEAAGEAAGPGDEEAAAGDGEEAGEIAGPGVAVGEAEGDALAAGGAPEPMSARSRPGEASMASTRNAGILATSRDFGEEGG